MRSVQNDRSKFMKRKDRICWKQRNIGNKYDLRKKTAFKYYAARVMSDYNVEIDKKVGLGLLNEERANKMKEELSSKVDTLIQMWSETGEKRLKEKLAELCFTEAVLEDLINNDKSEVEPMDSPTNIKHVVSFSREQKPI